MKTIGKWPFLTNVNTPPFSIRSSPIYDLKNRRSQVLKALINETNEEHKKTFTGQVNKSLTTEEILGQKKIEIRVQENPNKPKDQ